MRPARMEKSKSRLSQSEAKAMLRSIVTRESCLQGELPLPVVAAQTLDTNLPDERRRTIESEKLSPYLALRQFADDARARVCRNVVSGLQKIPAQMDMLETAWDEVCVQMQRGESVYWECAYLPSIKQAIRAEITKLSDSDKQAIWLQSDEGSDWWEDLDSSQGGAGSESAGGVPYGDEAIRRLILETVLSEAANYENSRIRSFLA